ncbi:protein NARROW LEAF 1-like [Andrographis paniculata]|uniref:protein NARROW LEAF 1-like n=1 Tax=Andrographis paniculata TaxID=175694 RepID=UPI0021E8E318|nr:protein NARROW LEAF 1-like [Andrographis paniculata]XP_051126167.1 protein NARROW LEAF 1-like [Andrographis paniculata]XP_051126168.1 protein NARROW LEAF 1-like [Andrographis paniculata]XP_051126169.1 protein NARROW LEAF 1-like [Andrographis paniculata]XP_051126170.1 protein NARROW LEAF 1-like [Andrographis paniculata]XP_051126171.1 protein NARROW LEAF 1-like [Andrographis paniculata]XP_051126172.1 protein NARROW LEAF 1-like [Andrographis paniculata]
MDKIMDRIDLRAHVSVSSESEESALDLERNHCNNFNMPDSSPSPSRAFASGGQLSDNNAAYFSWPVFHTSDHVEDRAHYFGNLQKGILPETSGRRPTGLQATTLLELMTIRAFHSKFLRRFSLGTAIGFRIRRGVLTNIPAILVFVARKVHMQWLNPAHRLPDALEGPGSVWCDVDVVEFAYYGVPAATPKEQLYTELVDGFGGGDPCIGSGSQVASQETYGTLGAIVKSRTGNRQVGFLTNRHVAVDLDYPSQKMFHPLPPSLGPGVYLGAVERATSFVADYLWYGIFAGANPETFVRADGAFIPFAEDFNMAGVTTLVKGIGEIGDVHIIDLQSRVGSLVGRQVVKVGRSSGLTTGTIMAYSLEYNDEKGICFFTDFLVVGENQQTFDLEGDSGSLILLTDQNGEKPRPVGIIWGGTANRGRLKLRVGQPPENWTSGVDLGRLLDLLELDLVTSNAGLHAALQEQRIASAARVGFGIRECASPELEQVKANVERVCEQNTVPQAVSTIHIFSADDDDREFCIKGCAEAMIVPSVEHQFIPSFPCKSLVSHNNGHSQSQSQSQRKRGNLENLFLLGGGDESEGEVCVSLQLGESEAQPKRRKQSDPLSSFISTHNKSPAHP